MNTEDYKKYCRYYNGERTAPKWMSQNERMFWYYEQYWVLCKTQKTIPVDYIREHPCLKDFEVDDGTPQDLKALICDRYCHFGGTEEGFMYMLYNEYSNRMLNKDRWERDRRLLYCRLYTGDADNEYEALNTKRIDASELIGGRREEKTSEEVKGIRSIFYYGEKLWTNDINETFKNKFCVSEYTNEVGIDFENDDDTPLELKILLYQIFMEYVDGLFHRFNTSYEVDLFKTFYKKYYQPLEMALNIRSNNRKPALIAKCRYYNGEEFNPWQDCRDGILLWRCNFWEWEKSWVESMAKTYTYKPPFDPLKMCNLPKDLYKTYGIPRTLLKHILAIHIGNLSLNACCVISGNAMKYFIENFYLKFVPLDGDVEKYFGFYTGDENEYESSSREGLFAFLESTFHKNCKLHDDFAEEWIMSAKTMKDSNDSKVCKLCNLKSIPIAHLAIALYVDAMVGKWCPYDDLDEIGSLYLQGVKNLSEAFYMT